MDDQQHCPDDCPECSGNDYIEQLGPNGLERADCPRRGIDTWRNQREGRALLAVPVDPETTP